MDDRPDSLEVKLFGAPLAALRERCSRHVALVRCLRAIEDEHADPLGLRAVAGRCGLEPSYLNRLLQDTVGLTFHQLVIRQRVLRVAWALHHTEHNVLEIALEHGFGSVRACQRAFRRLLGTTPQTYRRRAHPDSAF